MTILSSRSHVPPILPTNVEQRIGNLTETGHLDRLHQFFKHVSTVPRNLLKLLQSSSCNPTIFSQFLLEGLCVDYGCMEI